MRALAIVAVVILASASIAAPEKKPKEPAKKPAPELPTGETNWGRLEHAGKSFTLTGHPIWEGTGIIRDDGKVQIIWTLVATGEPCPAVYELKNGELVGEWSFSHEAKIAENGDLIPLPGCQTRGDIVYRKKE